MNSNKKKVMSRTLAMLLSAAMCVGMIAPAFAETVEDELENGSAVTEQTPSTEDAEPTPSYPSVTVTPGETGEDEFTLTEQDVLELPEEGKHTETKTSEDGSTVTTESNVTWLPEEEGYGYTSTETTTTRTETTTVVAPENAPANAEHFETEDGVPAYRYTVTETLEDGTVRTTEYTVVGGVATAWSETTVTKTVVKKVVLDEATGKLTVVMEEVEAGKDHGTPAEPGEDAEVKPIEIELPDVTEFYENDLYDRDGFNGTTLGVVNADLVNVRKGPGTQYANYGKDGQLSKNPNQMVYIYEKAVAADGHTWYRIGEDAWVRSDFVIGLGTYTVTAKSGLNVRKDAGASNTKVGTVTYGETLKITGIKLQGGSYWYQIEKDGKNIGWVSCGSNGEYISLAPERDSTAKPPASLDDVDWGSGEYEFVYLGETGLESIIRAVTKGDAPYKMHQYLLRDKDGNCYVVYCADADTNASGNFKYELLNLEELLASEDATEADKQALEHMKLVAQNGYWGNGDEDAIGSLDTVKENLKAYLKDSKSDAEIDAILSEVTPGLALAATQAALWYYGGGSDGSGVELDFANIEDWYKAVTGSYVPGQGLVGTGADEVKNNKIELTEYEKAALKALFESLIYAEPSTGSQLVTEEQFAQSVTVTVKNVIDQSITEIVDGEEIEKAAAETVYNTDVAIVMGVTKDQITGKLTVQIWATGEDGEPAMVGEADFFDNNRWNGNTLTIQDVELPNGAKLSIKLVGTQDLGQGVYVFQSEEKDGKTSQTFIGLAQDHIEKNVDLSVDLVFNVKNSEATITTTTTVGSEDDGNSDINNDQDSNTNEDRDEEEEEEEIPDPDTPLSEEPEEEIPDPDIPLVDLPDEDIELDDPDIPLADVPATGDISMGWYAAAALSACGLTVVTVGKKREGQED